MTKISIKVIKRKDAEATANANRRSAFEVGQTAPLNKEKVERLLRRELVGTVSNWISERKENSRLEKLAAFRKMFGGELLSSAG